MAGSLSIEPVAATPAKNVEPASYKRQKIETEGKFKPNTERVDARKSMVMMGKGTKVNTSA